MLNCKLFLGRDSPFRPPSRTRFQRVCKALLYKNFYAMLVIREASNKFSSNGITFGKFAIK